jgi:hypothetical protein
MARNDRLGDFFTPSNRMDVPATREEFIDHSTLVKYTAGSTVSLGQGGMTA